MKLIRYAIALAIALLSRGYNTPVEFYEREEEDLIQYNIVEPEPEPPEEIQPEPEPQYEYEEPIPMTYGDYGRLIIPNRDISVALYRCGDNTSMEYMQYICDAEDSANFISYDYDPLYADIYDDSPLISDHNYQAFRTLKQCQPGDLAYIYYPNGTYDTYIFDMIDYNGTNISKSEHGEHASIRLRFPRFSDGTLSAHNYQDGITLYTCNNDAEHITIVRFRHE